MTKALIRLFIRDAENTRDARVRERYGVLSGAVGIACNVFLFILKVVIGLVTGSISIAADAFNNLSDGLSCMISIVGFKVSGKAPDEKHPFGYGRTEYIAGLVVAFIIVLVGFEFFKTSIDRILHPAPVAFSLVLVVILAISMLVKLWMGAFNVQIGRRIDSPVLMAAGQDSRNDVITTGVVILGMVAGQFTTLPVDGYVGVLVAAFIVWAGFGIARDTVAPLLGEAADPEIAKNIEKLVMESEYIVGVHDLIVHNYGAGRWLASLHAEVPSDSDFVAVHEVIDEAEKRVWQRTGVYLVIHMDPIDVNNEHVAALREQVDAVLRAIDENLSMHDFRVVDGARQINLIFDVVVPFSYDNDAKRDLMMTIRDKLKEIDYRYNPVVTFDHRM
ncbi:cation diffusion facilitator family transporter [Agathobaculum sp.]|uniref:cation diffusion facilitator family transporter n=1 Tax=Agathobaculum sp. TaxID=2048138 RepID=UPI001F896376|nr:cation diffusion facilitator family transporter [Candidatus Agathobaculum intestinigallinarum]